jgi:hypothetical protein
MVNNTGKYILKPTRVNIPILPSTPPCGHIFTSSGIKIYILCHPKTVPPLVVEGEKKPVKAPR